MSLGRQVTLSSMRVAIRMCHSVTDSLGFFRDPLRADGCPAATLVCLRPCWHPHWETVKKIIFYWFCEYTYGSVPQNKGTSVTSRGEAILGWGWGCTAQPFTLARVGCCPSSEENCHTGKAQSHRSRHPCSPSCTEQAGDRGHSRLPPHWKQDRRFLQSTPITEMPTPGIL